VGSSPRSSWLAIACAGAFWLLLTGPAVPAQEPAAPPPPDAPAQTTPEPQPVPDTPAAVGQVPQDKAGKEKEKETFRSGVNLVSLSVSVVDEKGRYITDLTEDEILVFENGVPQGISFFETGRLPMAMVMLIDTSASMTYKLPQAQDAAMDFVKRLRGEDAAQVVGFQNKSRVLQEFTNDPIELQIAIQYLNPTGSTSLYNAVYVALKELAKLQATSPEEVRRKAVVILSDGEDTSSLIDFDDVVDLAKRTETSVYSVGMMTEAPRLWDKAKEAEFVLRRLARETGGQVFFASRTDDVAKAFNRIADELSNQYELGYVPNNAQLDGSWRQVAVRTTRQGLVTRARPGYFAPLATDQ
jgi:Ca-activated chloride channel family protein